MHTAVAMTTIDRDKLATIAGGIANPAKLIMKAGEFVFSKANNSAAYKWLTAHHIGRNETGNYTKQDGPFPSLYRYLYKIGSRQAPGAAD